jgi:hypothetical protein
MAGERARLLFGEHARFDLAVNLRGDGARLAEVFSFVSGLYFRGKAAYASAFAAAPDGVPSALVIVPGFGLLPVDTIVKLEHLRQMAAVPIDAGEARYRGPLERDARLVDRAAGSDCGFVLLGSIATLKYVEPLLAVFGERLLFPAEFVGRGDMSRGGLMLRCARVGAELSYTAVLGAVLRGARPPRLPKLR